MERMKLFRSIGAMTNWNEKKQEKPSLQHWEDDLSALLWEQGYTLLDCEDLHVYTFPEIDPPDTEHIYIRVPDELKPTIKFSSLNSGRNYRWAFLTLNCWGVEEHRQSESLSPPW